jgi:hypothetical protein
VAHTIKTDEEVGGTFHLEPDHNPQAGEVALVWFALTRRGGTPIPLQDCECQLQIFQHPYTPEADPLFSPQLESLSVENFADIPSAEVIFPEPGLYDLHLSGRVSEDPNSTPFQLEYSVTVRR